jgi:hypothetical protein
VPPKVKTVPEGKVRSSLPLKAFGMSRLATDITSRSIIDWCIIPPQH